MAGKGRRFMDAGYNMPKPLIPVLDNKTVIESVIEGLGVNVEAQFIFIVQQEHCDKYQLDMVLKKKISNCIIIPIDYVTEGQLCTVLLAESYINNDDELLICNCDINVNWDFEYFMEFSQTRKSDGVIVTTTSSNPAFSFVQVNSNGIVTETAEKRVISKNGNVGIFYWKRGSEFVKYGHLFIDENVRVNNEFYIGPMYNNAIKDGKRFVIYEVHHPLSFGTPEELELSIQRIVYDN